jgi:hypothetical protein
VSGIEKQAETTETDRHTEMEREREGPGMNILDLDW